MRFNKQELITLASQSAHKYEKQGILILRESDGKSFFRRTESEKRSSGKVKRRDSFSCVAPSSGAFREHWFRLSGNLLFYLKTTDHWSEPIGVIVLENYTVKVDVKPPNQQAYHFVIGFDGGCYYMSAHSESERSSWMNALQSASFTTIRAKLDSLKLQIHSRMGRTSSHSLPPPHSTSSSTGNITVSTSITTMMMTTTPSSSSPVPLDLPKACGYVKESQIDETPLCEISLACDNLPCSYGREPHAKLIVHVRNSPNHVWCKYSCTETVERSSNPVFLTTISFRLSDGISEDSQAKFTVVDVRERITQTQTVIGQLTVELGSLKNIDRIRLPITSYTYTNETVPHHSGFLSIYVWNLEREERCSTESTPCRSNPYESGSDSMTFFTHHRRTQSLPPLGSLGSKLKIPLQNNFGLFLCNPFIQTYRFHSGLGGDIFIHEIMAESKFSFLFPQQLLNVWIAEEKELCQEIIALGELKDPWHSRQVQILERHLWLINVYTQARQNLAQHKGPYFKQSSQKADPTYEFAPLNLHLQRIIARNESLHKTEFHDTFTVGAFTAYSLGYSNGGLVKLLQTWKHFGEKEKGKASWYITNKVNMTYDCVQGIKRLRKEIVEKMQAIIRLAKERKTQGMLMLSQKITLSCRLLLSICDQSLINEAFDFLEHQKLTLPTSTSLDFAHIEDQNRIDEGIQVETPNSPLRSVVEMFKKRTEAGAKVRTEDRTPDSGLGAEDIVPIETWFNNLLDSPSSNYYRPSEEPEPWDLTTLNIEASLISLNSKVKVLCGSGAENNLPPTNFIRPSHSLQRFSSMHVHSYSANPKLELESRRTAVGQWRKSMREEISQEKEKSLTCAPLALPLPSRSTCHQNGYIDHTDINSTNNNVLTNSASELENGDWSEELRASVKKLRLAIDGLLKSSRLAHSIFRLQENCEKAKLGYAVKYRRDVVFSHSLTSLVSGLMTRLWCRKPDPSFLYVLTRLGVLVSFHSLLTYHSHEAEMFLDMIVAIEDLKTVEFVLVLYDAKIHGHYQDSSSPPCPMPKIQGCRSQLKVLLPVPESVFSLLPVENTRSTTFVVTPVFFNIGINEQATLAERFGNLEPQDKSNLDNFARLNEYHRRFKKLTLPVSTFPSKRKEAVEPNIDVLLDKMHQEIISKKKKNVEILHISSLITRLMMGLRFTSCKSGKDRSSMGVTVEQCHILSQDYDLAEHEFKLALDAFRSEGTRRENTLKNIGQKKYAFNALQSYALPKLYRPPHGTFGNVQS